MGIINVKVQTLFLCIRLLNDRVGEIYNVNESGTPMNPALCRSRRIVLCSDASLSIACRTLFCCTVDIACKRGTLDCFVNTYETL